MFWGWALNLRRSERPASRVPVPCQNRPVTPNFPQRLWSLHLPVVPRWDAPLPPGRRARGCQLGRARSSGAVPGTGLSSRREGAHGRGYATRAPWLWGRPSAALPNVFGKGFEAKHFRPLVVTEAASQKDDAAKCSGPGGDSGEG